jgi:outer membrane protein
MNGMKRIVIIFCLLLVGLTPSFGQLADSLWSLQKCIDYAIINNLTIRQSQLNADNMYVTLEQSKANRIPVVSGTATQGFSFGRSIDPFSNQYVNQNIRSNNFSLNGSWTLFNGLQVQHQIQQNKLAYQSDIYQVEADKSTLIVSIVQGYYQILLAQEQVGNAQLQVASTQSQIERTEKQVKAGSVAEINLIQLQSQLANDKLTLTNAENQVYLAKVALMQLLNLPLQDKFLIVTPTEGELIPGPVNAMNTEQIYQEALGTQPIIKSLELNKESTIVGIRTARGSKYPRLTLNSQVYTGYSSARSLTVINGTQITTIGFLQSNPTELVSTQQSRISKQNYPFRRQLTDNVSENFTFNLTIPILNNRQARTNVDRARLNLKAAEVQEENGKLQLRKNIEQAYANMRSSENSYNSAKSSVDLQEQNYLNSERRFNLGMLSPYDFLIQKNTFFQAKYTYSQMKYQYFLYSKVLEFYQKNQLQ